MMTTPEGVQLWGQLARLLLRDRQNRVSGYPRFTKSSSINIA